MNRIKKAEVGSKLCKITKRYVGLKKVPTVAIHDGRTIRYPNPIIKASDSVKLNLETGEIEKVLKFDLGCLVMITKGRNVDEWAHWCIEKDIWVVSTSFTLKMQQDTSLQSDYRQHS